MQTTPFGVVLAARGMPPDEESFRTLKNIARMALRTLSTGLAGVVRPCATDAQAWQFGPAAVRLFDGEIRHATALTAQHVGAGEFTNILTSFQLIQRQLQGDWNYRASGTGVGLAYKA